MQAQQQLTQPGDEEPPRDGAPASPGFAAKAVAAVAARPGLALAIIVVLVLVVAFLFAQSRGWLGGGGGRAASPKVSSEESDPETESLIKSINESGVRPPA